MKKDELLKIELKIEKETYTNIIFRNRNKNLPLSIFIESDCTYDNQEIFYELSYVINDGGGDEGYVSTKKLFEFLLDLYRNPNYTMYVKYQNNVINLLSDDLINNIYCNLKEN